MHEGRQVVTGGRLPKARRAAHVTHAERLASATVWTAPMVNTHLIQAFRMLPGHAVFTVPGRIRSFDAHPAVAATFSWGPRFLGTYPRARTHLFAWARCRAQRVSWSEYCVLMGWPHSTAEKSRALAASLIADGLNKEALGSVTPSRIR